MARLSTDVIAIEHAIAILQDDAWSTPPAPLGPICLQWRQRAIHHLQRRVDAMLRERPKIDSEQMFYAMLKDVAAELRQAGAALEVAAQQLIAKGAGRLAQQAHFASQRAIKAADGLVNP